MIIFIVWAIAICLILSFIGNDGAAGMLGFIVIVVLVIDSLLNPW